MGDLEPEDPTREGVTGKGGRGNLNKGQSPDWKKGAEFSQGGGGTASSPRGDQQPFVGGGGKKQPDGERSLVPYANESLRVVGQSGPVDGQESISILSLPIEVLSKILEYVLDQNFTRTWMKSGVGSPQQLNIREAHRLSMVSKQFRESLALSTAKELALPHVRTPEDVNTAMKLALRLFKNVTYLDLSYPTVTEGNPELAGLQSLIVRNTRLSHLTIGDPRNFTGARREPETVTQYLDMLYESMVLRDERYPKSVSRKLTTLDIHMWYRTLNKAKLNRLLTILPQLKVIDLDIRVVNFETIEIISGMKSLYHLDDTGMLSGGNELLQAMTAPRPWIFYAIRIPSIGLNWGNAQEDAVIVAEAIDNMMRGDDPEHKVMIKTNTMEIHLNQRTNFVISGFTLLEYAMMREQIELAQFLLENGANPNFTVDNEMVGSELGYYSRSLDDILKVFHDYPEEAELTSPGLMLLLNYGADLNAKDNFGTPLFRNYPWNTTRSPFIDKIEWMKRFMEYGADLNLTKHDQTTLEEYLNDRLLIRSFDWLDFLLEHSNLSAKSIHLPSQGLTIAEVAKNFLVKQSQLTAEEYAQKILEENFKGELDENFEGEDDFLPFEEYQAEIVARLRRFQ